MFNILSNNDYIIIMGNTICCPKKTSCQNTDLYNFNLKLYYRNNTQQNTDDKQWFVLSKNNFYTVHDENVAKAILYGSR